VKRPGYRFTVENTIHVREDRWGSGVGRDLMDALVDEARDSGKHTMVAAVDGANEASIRFHTRLGFVEVARMPEIGAKFGR
jgi:phosphinothricin acetyltransferase